MTIDWLFIGFVLGSVTVGDICPKFVKWMNKRRKK